MVAESQALIAETAGQLGLGDLPEQQGLHKHVTRVWGLAGWPGWCGVGLGVVVAGGLLKGLPACLGFYRTCLILGRHRV